jgi:hypothetical protein
VINICDICKQYVCPSACPNFLSSVSLHGSAVGACFLCAGSIYDGNDFYVHNERLICAECACELIPSELLEFLECESIAEFFEMLW